MTQQLLNNSLDNTIFFNNSNRIDKIGNSLVKKHDIDFSPWWDAAKSKYGFTSLEQKVYLTLSEGQLASSDEIASHCNESVGSVQDAFDTLVGTGVVLKLSDDNYRVGSRLFLEWVKSEIPYRANSVTLR